MDELDEVVEELNRARGRVLLRRLEDRSVAFDVPDPMLAHSYVTVQVRRAGDGWVLSDGGLTAFSVGGSLEQLTDHAECAGLAVESDGEALVRAVDGTDRLGDAIARFAAEVASVPAMARLVDCATAKDPQPRPRTAAMARTVRGALHQQFPSLRRRHAVKLGPKLRRGPVTVKPRLVVFGGPQSRPTPAIACEFIDLDQPARSLGQAYNAAAGTFRALPDVRRRFLVAAGPDGGIDELGAMFDRDEVTTVHLDDLEALYASTRELEGVKA